VAARAGAIGAFLVDERREWAEAGMSGRTGSVRFQCRPSRAPRAVSDLTVVAVQLVEPKHPEPANPGTQ
jgi:hypothetical protein